MTITPNTTQLTKRKWFRNQKVNDITNTQRNTESLENEDSNKRRKPLYLILIAVLACEIAN